MLKKSSVAIIMALFLCACIGIGNGACEDKDNEVKVLTKEEEEASTAENIKNFLCPVSEDDIDRATAIKVEYKGKIYSLCCEACVKHFRKHPDKFAQKALAGR